MYHSFAGGVYSGGVLRGFIYGNSMTEIKRKASKLCNSYYHVIDEIKLHRCNNTENGVITFTRMNKKSPDNCIVRGKWN